MTHPITVVSLGPGSREYLTLGALEALKNAKRIILRTGRCDAADYLRAIGLTFETLDALHEACDDFDELQSRAVQYLVGAAEDGEICYAVFDAAADGTVRALRGQAPCRLLPGVPLSAPFLPAVNDEKIEIQTASALDVTGTQNPLLILECDSRMLMSECKLQLLKWYGQDQPVLFFAPSGEAARGCVSLPLCELDRQKQYDHTCAVLLPGRQTGDKTRFDFYDLVRIMRLLRGEDGCPWDLEQTHETLKKYLIEEAYETAAAIEEEDWDHVAEELGDVLLQVVFQADIGEKSGTFELTDITTAICKKMIARHRHIFGGDTCKTAEDVTRNWEKIKKEERGYATQAEALRGVSRGLPSLMRAGKVQKKARDVGFDWDDPKDALQKVHEEADEVLEALREKDAKHLREELGDLLFACVNVARLCGEEAEWLLFQATDKFISRFAAMEQAILQDGKCLEGLTLLEMDVYWNGSKQRPKT